MQKFYFNLFLQKEVGHRYLNIRSFDKVAKDCCNEFSKSIFLGAGVEEFFSSNKSFLLLNMFRKNEKNNRQKCLIVCALTETDYINPFQVDLLSPHHLKPSGFRYF